MDPIWNDKNMFFEIVKNNTYDEITGFKLVNKQFKAFIETPQGKAMMAKKYKECLEAQNDDIEVIKKIIDYCRGLLQYCTVVDDKVVINTSPVDDVIYEGLTHIDFVRYNMSYPVDNQNGITLRDILTAILMIYGQRHLSFNSVEKITVTNKGCAIHSIKVNAGYYIGNNHEYYD
jgi:hypothetical protein